MTHTKFIISLILGGLLIFSLLLNKIPKTYTGKFWDFLKANYHKHIFGGGLFGVILSTTFSGVFEGIQLFLTIFLSGALGVCWEWFWKAFNNTEPDYNDVYYTIGAALIPVILSM
jgi:hypothetical protein